MEVEAAKMIGAGLAVIALAGVGVGIGIVFIVKFCSLLKQFETGQPPFGVGLKTTNSFALTPAT